METIPVPMLTENHLGDTLASGISAMVKICRFGKVKDATAAEGVLGKADCRLKV